MQSLNLAVIPGDGIGPEITAEALETLKLVSTGVLDVQETTFRVSSASVVTSGPMPSPGITARFSDCVIPPA